MPQFGKAFLLGLATVLPLALTLYLVYFLARSAEQLMGTIILSLGGEPLYFPGLGLIAAVTVLTGVGYLIRLPGLGLLVSLNDGVMARIPVVKTIYSTIRDLMDFIAATRRGEQARRPVWVTVADGIRMVGLVTDPNLGEGRVLVYLPMSYQLGGYMLAVNKDQLTELDMTVENALRFVMTAGIQRTAATDSSPD